jgi:hypothetical protein
LSVYTSTPFLHAHFAFENVYHKNLKMVYCCLASPIQLIMVQFEDCSRGIMSASMLNAANQGTLSTQATAANVPLSELRALAVPMTDTAAAVGIIQHAGWV